jgi:ribosomal protein L10
MTTGLMTEATKGDDPVKAAKVIEESLKKAGIPAVAKVEGDVVTIKKVLKD